MSEWRHKCSVLRSCDVGWVTPVTPAADSGSGQTLGQSCDQAAVRDKGPTGGYLSVISETEFEDTLYGSIGLEVQCLYKHMKFNDFTSTKYCSLKKLKLLYLLRSNNLSSMPVSIRQLLCLCYSQAHYDLI